jgi:hypothetical protein
LRDKELYLNRGEDNVKGPHAEGSKSAIDREASGSKMGPNRAERGRSAPAGLACFEPGSRLLLIYVLLYILPLPPSAATSIHSSERHRHEGEAPGGSQRPSQVLELPRRWLRLDRSRHGWPCVMKPWWSSGAVPWTYQGTCTLDGDINLILSLLLIYFDACLLLFMCVAST